MMVTKQQNYDRWVLLFMCQAVTLDSFPRRGALTKQLSPSYTVQKSVRSVITLQTEKISTWRVFKAGQMGPLAT